MSIPRYARTNSTSASRCKNVIGYLTVLNISRLDWQVVQRSRDWSNQLAVKPPRPPLRQCRSPRSEEDPDYDNMTSSFSFPVQSNVEEGQWIPTRYLDSWERSPSFRRRLPAQRQRSTGTSSLKQLSPVHHAASWHDRGPTDQQMSLEGGDLSVCIGLTVQCSPMAVRAIRTSDASHFSNTRRNVTPRCGAAATVHPVSRRNSHPTRLGPVRSYDDVPDYRSRRQGADDFRFRYSVDDAPPFHRRRRSHPPAGPDPQLVLRRGFQVPYSPSHPSTVDWKGYTYPGSPSFEDFAVGFENEALTPVSADDLGVNVQGQSGPIQGQSGPPGLLDRNDEMAFDEITQQIASLTQTVNELRFKRRPPGVPVTRSSEDSTHDAFRHGDINRKQR